MTEWRPRNRSIVQFRIQLSFRYPYNLHFYSSVPLVDLQNVRFLHRMGSMGEDDLREFVQNSHPSHF